MSSGQDRQLVMVGVPIDCSCAAEPGSPPFGTELSPAALRAAGLLAATGAEDGGDLSVRLVGRRRDPGTGLLGAQSVLSVTSVVRDRVHSLLAHGAVPFLVGGCCTLLPGALAGTRDAVGTAGLAYLDGHLDLYDGRTSPSGEAADMPISVITGLGPAEWSAAVGAPLVAPGQLALIGPRDREDAAADGSAMPEDSGLEHELTPASLRTTGMAESGVAAALRLAATAGRYWVHLDVDILDELEFPATDYLMPGGLSLADLTDLLRPIVSSPALAGISLACYNPAKDRDQSAARNLVRVFASVLDPRARTTMNGSYRRAS